MLHSVSGWSRYHGRLRRYRLLIAALVALAVVPVSALLAPSAHGVTLPARGPASRVASRAPASPTAPATPASPAPSHPGLVRALPARARGTFVVLQMNLCNSGMAHSCYSFGRAVDEAVAKIHRYVPDVVTVQEVCHDDVYSAHGWGPLAQAMADLYGDDHISANFVAAGDQRTGEGFRCVNNQFYGIAVISHSDTTSEHYGWYRSQDSTGEVRAWTCSTVIPGRLTGCTTHLSTRRNVAMRQCHELMSILDSPWVLPDVVVSGDFNLTANPSKPYNVRDCVPAGYHRRSDDALQQVFFAGHVRWLRGGYAPMRWTDHPVLYETFRI